MKNTLLVTLFILGSVFAMAQENPTQSLGVIRLKPGFSAEIPQEICKSEFPNYKIVKRILSVPQQKAEISIFAFTTKPFDASLKSILVIHGGPGGMWNRAGAESVAAVFSKYNTVFFHYRGGGCSRYPSIDEVWDSTITSQSTLGDMEGIRSIFGVKKWFAVVGFSYGTNLARRYAHSLPMHLENLILEGLDAMDSMALPTVPFVPAFPVTPPPHIMSQQSFSAADSSTRILNLINSRYQVSNYLKGFISAEKYKAFMFYLSEYFQRIPPEQNYQMLGFWELYSDTYMNYFKSHNLQIPIYFNRATYAAVTAMAYLTADSNADFVIAHLMSQFGYGALPEQMRVQVASYLSSLTYSFFPFLNPNFIEDFKRGQLISFRVQMAMSNNDRFENAANLCQDIPTLVLNGTADSATPVENVFKYLSNKKCATSPQNRSLVVAGGGHSNLVAMKCLGAAANVFLIDKNHISDLTLCERAVALKSY